MAADRRAYSGSIKLGYSFLKEHRRAQCIATRKQLRKELQDVYGGESDSDGEGYDTDEDYRPEL